MDVSIVITSYNYEKYIEESIESCLNQVTSCNYEVIIVDDGSTDRTSEILRKYSPYCTIIYNKNAGVEVASNIGIRRTKSKYFISFHSI